MGRQYAVPISAVAVTAAQDLWELKASSTQVIKLLRFNISQNSDDATSESEMLRLTIRRVTGAPTSGSGGSASTPAILSAGDAAAGFTAEINNTTRISGGTATTIFEDSFNVLSGFSFDAEALGLRFEFTAGTYCVIGLEDAPTDSLTMNGTAIVEEIG